MGLDREKKLIIQIKIISFTFYRELLDLNHMAMSRYHHIYQFTSYAKASNLIYFIHTKQWLWDFILQGKYEAIFY